MPKFDKPQPPVFERVEEERLYRKQRLAAAFRLFARFVKAQQVILLPATQNLLTIFG